MGEPKTVITVAKKDSVETITREQLPAALADKESRVWVDLENTGTGGFDQLQPALVFHPMAVEDCVTDVNFPRLICAALYPTRATRSISVVV